MHWQNKNIVRVFLLTQLVHSNISPKFCLKIFSDFNLRNLHVPISTSQAEWLLQYFVA